MANTKEWTLMFYFASDNQLAPSIVSQLKAIKEAGYHPDANVLAQFDPHTVNTPAHIFDVNLINKLKDPGHEHIGFSGKDPYVRNLVLDKLWGEEDQSIRHRIREFLNKNTRPRGHWIAPIADDSAVSTSDLFDQQDGEEDWDGDSSDESDSEDVSNGVVPYVEYNPPMPSLQMAGEQNPKEALANFLDFCRQHYPARHYILFILGHGIAVGNDLFLLDEHAPQHSLSLTDLGRVLGKFKNDIEQDDGQLELIGFHSCSMSALEVAYELRGTARFMLASQGPAFVGSWPYRQILIRVFNDLTPRFRASDLKEAAYLATQFKEATDPVTTYLRGRLNSKTIEKLDEYVSNQKPDKQLLRALLKELNLMILDTEFHRAEPLQQVKLSKKRELLLQQNPQGKSLRRLNYQLLMDAYPEAITRPIKEMLTKIFYYCLYNSYDFQLAGYSYDLSLCDLSKVRELNVPLSRFATELREGLEDAERKEGSEDAVQQEPDLLIRDLILLAHWDAQSYWDENYTDLYDLCFCLKRRCESAKPASQKTDTRLRVIKDECQKIMETLLHRTNGVRDGVIVRSGFAGPLYQYSHGLSIFFPWSKPVGSQMWDEEYEKYKLNEKTSWRKLLNVYFTQTMRKPHDEEQDPNCEPASATLDRDLLELLLRDVTSRVFNSSGQLAKSGPEDRTGGKYGPNDPTGGACDCPSFKNYPFITRARDERAEEQKSPASTKRTIPLSPNFFEKFSLR